MRLTSPSRTLATAAALTLALAGCASDDPDPEPGPSGDASPTGEAAVPDDLEIAESETREDSVYPDAGDPLVDSLHHHLDLAWSPEDEQLEAIQTFTFRATSDAGEFQLDFNDVLEIETLTVDGEEVGFEQSADDLLVEQPVVEDQQYEIVLEYAGTPEPAEAPTSRQDFSGGVGWNITADSEVWTAQEPYGAHTWYAVNDQPADKALYDFTLTVPEPWTGVANGELTATDEADGLRTTTWHLAEPASSYLVTVAFADHTLTELTSESGVPIQIWSLTDDPGSIGDTEYAPEAMTWLEERLGPYPFDTFGVVINNGATGMETQTMITLGNTEYATSKAVMVHELAHHWYGNTISPADWSDVWMNEGMAMYLQWLWEAEDSGQSVDFYVDAALADDQYLRDEFGPPAAYDRGHFAQNNIYTIPGTMWHHLRQDIGDEKFWDMVRAWPAEQENAAADRKTYLDWIEQQTGEELSDFFDAWLLGEQTPTT